MNCFSKEKEAHYAGREELAGEMGGKPEERVMLSGCLRQNGNVVFDERYLEARGDGGEVSIKTTPL